MRTTTAGLTQRIRSGCQDIVGALREAASGGHSLDTDDLTDLLKVAFSEHYRIQAALTSAIGALDAVAEKAPDGELTMGLTCATWLSHYLQLTSSAAYA